MNQPPEYCPYCGAKIIEADPPTPSVVEVSGAYRCESCDDYVYYNPTLGGSTAVVDDESLLLVEDFRSSGEWKLPAGRIELGESPREGVARELKEETGLFAGPTELVYFYDSSGEPMEDQYIVNIDYAIPRSKTTGTVEAGSDATDARFFTPGEFVATEYALKETHVDRFETDSLQWLLNRAQQAVKKEAEASC